MTFDEIRHALETARRMPTEALAAATPYADDFLPLVTAIASKLSTGVYLTPDQDRLLFYGVHILAAAPVPAFWPVWRDLLREPSERLDATFGDGLSHAVMGVTLALVGEDVDAVFDLLEGADLYETVRWGLFNVLARLTWEGRIELARTHAFLEHFERDGPIGEQDMGWFGWIDAVMLLGLTDLSAEMKRVYARKCFVLHREVDLLDTAERLEAAAANPGDGQRFVDDGVEAIDDPVKGLAWLAAIESYQDEHEPDAALDVAGERLTQDERSWLRGFVESDQAPEGTMLAEQLDGFFHALAVGPVAVPASDFMPYVWGGSVPGDEPVWDSEAQRQYASRLFEQYYQEIADGIAAGVTPRPWIEHDPDQNRGRTWAAGFLAGVLPSANAWTPLSAHPEANRLIRSIMALYEDDAELLRERVTPRVRARILGDLPMILLTIAQFWRDPTRFDAPPTRRIAKIGRNEPCPCGSGKKYKKCCGAEGAERGLPAR